MYCCDCCCNRSTQETVRAEVRSVVAVPFLTPNPFSFSVSRILSLLLQLFPFVTKPPLCAVLHFYSPSVLTDLASFVWVTEYHGRSYLNWMLTCVAQTLTSRGPVEICVCRPGLAHISDVEVSSSADRKSDSPLRFLLQVSQTCVSLRLATRIFSPVSTLIERHEAVVTV